MRIERTFTRVVVRNSVAVASVLAAIAVAPRGAHAQLKDVFPAPNAVHEGIH